MKFIFRIFISVILLAILCIAGLFIYLFSGQAEPAPQITFGITFSQIFAEDLDLDWQKTFLAILDDLAVKKLRLIAYWPRVEPEPTEYSFVDLDWQISQAQQRGAEVVLVIGRKVPRWPECHIPDWASNLSESAQQEKILLLLEKIVNHYQDNQTIKTWQVENEPFLRTFGDCPKLDKEFLDKEIALVRQLDSQQRPIIVTTSGELSLWLGPARRADILGTTLYRNVWVRKIGNLTYPIPPVFYYKRANLVKWLTQIEKVIIVELQAEPWIGQSVQQASLEEQSKSMDLEKFKGIIEYVWQTGFDQAYFWGVEWWYWLKEKHQDDGIWQEAKQLWTSQS